MASIPRSEFPRPQIFRGDDSWINLNGEWEFELDMAGSGTQRWFHDHTRVKYTKKITVPFVPESKLSGIEETDFIRQCWYRRELPVPADFDSSKERLLLHFGAVNYDCTVHLNIKEIATHAGGYTPFTVDITDEISKDTPNILTVRAGSDVRSYLQPTGKQAMHHPNEGCMYTRNTGIWQTVWLERVPRSYIENVTFIPDVKNEKVSVRVTVTGDAPKGVVRADISYRGEAVTSVSKEINMKNASFDVAIPDPVLWDIGKGELYDVHLTFGDDALDTYFGMRSVELDGKKLLLNGRPVFLRLVLDQGYYPDSIITAPTVEELYADIDMAMSNGFTGARMHMKVFEPAYIDYANRKGYLVWGEYPSWGLDIGSDRVMEVMLPEWLEELERDMSNPAIVCWVPINECCHTRDRRLLHMLYNMTKAIDPSRPVIDTSGYFHVITDIYDVHNYQQDTEQFAKDFGYERMKDGDVFRNYPDHEIYEGQPYFVSEFGGTAFIGDSDQGSNWGYGVGVKNEEEFYERLGALVKVLTSNPLICGFCYTQLTDVFQEVNGLYKFDRTPKFDSARLREIFGMKAAIEE